MSFFTAFGLERYFAQHEFSASKLLCCSDCESMSVQELCAMEDTARDALQSLRLGYTESRGAPELRADIAKLYTGLTGDDVFMHAGAEEAILNLYLALLHKGDRVIVNTPCYQSLYEIPRALGASVLAWQYVQEKNRWFLDPDRLEKLLTKSLSGDAKNSTTMVVLNTPHNPTGALLRRNEFDRIVELCRTYGAILLCDEVYRFLERDSAAHLPAACEVYEHGISLSVLSKAWGLAGLRIGWLATQCRDILDKVAVVKDYNSICASGPSEILAGIAVRNTEKIVARNQRLCAENIVLLDAFFHDYADSFSWIPPQAGSIAFPKCIGGNAKSFSEKLLRETGVLLLPGELYKTDGTGRSTWKQHFRIGFGRASMPDALGSLRHWLGRPAAATKTSVAK